ncbi:MAG: 4Fe-4S ferredoxin [Bacteroidales bacterium]|nr:4Fe-4S ferredoxin [Bacteroidales bacterium]
MNRKIIKIDEQKCDGCGLCIPNCHEGALQIIDGKARLVSDLMCDGLGACIGYCPQGAITLEEREAAPYNEEAVMKEMIPKGFNTVVAHLEHLKEHKEFGYLKQGVRYLNAHREELSFDPDEVVARIHSKDTSRHQPAMAEARHQGGGCGGGGCPGTQEQTIESHAPETGTSYAPQPSQLKHWPVQMHLIHPSSDHFKGSDLLLAADCVAYAMGDFHSRYLKSRPLAIACPKLDSNKETYVQKLIALINEAKVNTITLMKMEVPCCGGLLQLAHMAREHARRKVPLKAVTVGIQGDVLSEEWI